MAIHPKKGKLLYHLTSIENLSQIFKNGLRARNKLTKFDNIADPEIIKHRKKHNLNHLIPFHFFPGTPFAGKVQMDNPEQSFVYITVKRKIAEDRKYKIITQHPLSMDPPILLSYKKGIKRINWELMGKRDYNDQTCKLHCMAECLSKKAVMPKDFHSVYCSNESDSRIATSLKLNIKINGLYINVKPEMFKT